MTEINKQELKKIQLNILDKVATLCENQNIKYSLYGGTLLGAIRHKGYIPWDDDIDISMPRPDYERFINCFHLIEDPDLKIHDSRFSKKYPYPYIKVSDERTVFKENFNINYSLGVNIDIFPIDGLPLLEKDSIKIMKKSNFYRKLIELKLLKINKDRAFRKNLTLFISRMVLLIVPIHNLVTQITKLAKMSDYKQSSFIGNIVWGYGNKERCNKRVYDDFILRNFEEGRFKVMVGYNEYLKNVFNEYMLLPPIEKQVTHHSYTAYIK